MPRFSSEGTTDYAENWRRWLGKFIGTPAQAIEIGTFEGRSALWLLDNILTHKDAYLRCVDPFTGGEDHIANGVDCSQCRRLAIENLLPYTGKVHICEDTSFKWLRVFNSMEQKFDFAYVDGSHIAKDVLCDLVLLWPLIKVGGVVICDDYLWKFKGPLHEPKIAIDAFLAIYAEEVKVIEKGYQIVLEKTK